MESNRSTLRRLSCEQFDAFESRIDTEYFGVTSAIAVLKAACVTDQTQSELLDFIQGFEFTTVINKANDPINNHWLGRRTNAFLADMNIQFKKKVSITEKGIGSLRAPADNFPEDSRIIQIAENAFEYSRFLNDPYLPSKEARTIYGDIVRNAFKKLGRYFVIAGSEDEIAGFLLFSMNESTSSSTIELIGLRQHHTGRGIGRSLIMSMEHYVGKMDIETMQVGTQLNNLGALKFYQSYGFNFLECRSIYHYWPSRP